MLSFHIATIHPEFIEAYKKFGVFQAAEKKSLASIEAINLRQFAYDKHGSVDDRPYVGGDGMVLSCEPLAQAVKTVPNAYVICPSPSGKKWCQKDSERLAQLERPLVFVAGRFSGIDQRFCDHYVDEEFSLGDYVISGGELAALTMADSILRNIPGVLGNTLSSHYDSFAKGLQGSLEYPVYTRPPVFEGKEVPKVLLSGDHEKIETWRKEKSLEKTKRLRPDLL